MGRYPWTEYFLFELLYITIFYPTPHHTYRIAVLLAMVYLAGKVYLTPETAGPVSVTYTVGFAIAFHFAFMAYILCAGGSFPDHWRRVRDEVCTGGDGVAGGSEKGNLPSEFPPTKKFWWMLDIAYSDRMVGWVQEPRNCLPSRPPPSRKTFLWKTSLKLIFNLILSDLVTLVLAQNPAFDPRVHDPTDGPETYLAAIPILHRVPYIIVLGVRWESGISTLYFTVALVCVGLGGSSPTLWPDIWGRWQDAYTIRNLWGQTWHQRLRPTVAGLGRLVANKFFKFPPGTNRSSYVQLYVAFFVSGAIHSAADFTIDKRPVYRSLKFFLLQATVITFEGFLIHVTKRSLLQAGIQLKPGRVDESWVETVVKVFGYCWVILWLCLTVPVWMDGASAAGFNSTDRGPISQFLLDTWKHRV